MPSCVMRKCTNYGSKTNKFHGITYHKFPCNELVRQDWIVVVRKQRSEDDWLPTKCSTICSDHFSSSHKYTSGKGRTLLKKMAVPVLKKHENLPLHCDSPNSLEEVDISDMASIFDTPKKFALKKRVRKLVLEKEKIRKKYKILLQQNQRLKRNISSMKSILNNLKNRNYILEQQLRTEPKA